jgi:hypothetical protein
MLARLAGVGYGMSRHPATVWLGPWLIIDGCKMFDVFLGQFTAVPKAAERGLPECAAGLFPLVVAAYFWH